MIRTVFAASRGRIPLAFEAKVLGVFVLLFFVAAVEKLRSMARGVR